MSLKIGLLNDSFPPMIDGVANAVKAYADILSEHDEPVVITPKYPHIVDKYPYEVFRYQSIPTDKILSYRAGNPFNPISVAELINKKFDILHVHCPFASAVLAIIIKKLSSKKIPLVFTYHTKFDIDITKRIPIKKMRRFITKFLVKNISAMDEVWVVSEGAGENLRDIGYKGAYRVMPNGTDFEKRRADDSLTASLKKKHGIKDDEKVFLFVGRMMWYKNIGIIINAMKILKEKGIKFKMVMVGQGDDLFSMQHYAQELGLKDNFVFTGAVFDRELLRGYYSIADLFIFPSTYDTSGLVVKEAAACNCPSVLVKNSCAAEGIEDKISGYLCEENAESCADTIFAAINDEKTLRQVSICAGEKVYYSWNDAVNDAKLRYEELIKSKKTKESFWRR